jgi:hypothetical protein
MKLETTWRRRSGFEPQRPFISHRAASGHLTIRGALGDIAAGGGGDRC